MSKHPSTVTGVCVLQVRLAIAEKGLRCEEYDVSLPLSEHNEPWFMHLNPAGEVPVLVHNDNVICDPTQIMDYLEQNFNGEMVGLNKNCLGSPKLPLAVNTGQDRYKAGSIQPSSLLVFVHCFPLLAFL